VTATALIAWGLLVVLAAWLVARRERRRAAAERALRESERRLHQAQKMDALGRLAGGVAHDVNNYLAAIRTQCELLERRARAGRADPEDVARKMELVVATVLKASSLVERLLAFGRRHESHPERLDVNEVVEMFAGMMGGSLGEGVTLETRLAPGLPAVEADLSQLEQVLANLVVNARDAVAGEGRIRIETAAAGDPGEERVTLAVSDTGPGIPPAIRDQIFDPFFTTREGVGASGLGLATVYALVEEAGGRVEVESDPGRAGSGDWTTTFRIFLPPAGTERPAGEPAGRNRVGAEGAPGGPGRGERILLVDDSPELREAVRSLLEAQGYAVTAVSGREEALAAAAAGGAGRGFDLVVTDVRLGDGTGPELLERLRAERGPLPALYMSGYTDRISLRPGTARGQASGEAFFVKKPFSGDGLARMIRELLDRRGAGGGGH